ncbi:hypothetical protein DEI93_07855 [Curtobacterium sp. MCBD17_035]|uniref:hypothetical protein n=1 Tax=Curtobacterium sp. MCBD17_035 TaxID=2175673 RepID=UPI0011B36969|nr:hypothetical protein [Curtobacterium sp. MCBD17_035]WIB68933.1 hypothetical protein DEI93_07855 [Curtobacterium sp. MCBD17_035]
MTSPSGRGPRRHRGVVVGGGIVFVIGLAALVLGGWFDAVTADGGGANIGAGVLVLFGGIVAATGAVMLLVVTAGTVAARTRR